MRAILSCLLLLATFTFTVGCDGGSHARNKPPIASFAATPEHGVSPQVVAFDATASYDLDGAITAWDWDFGDGTAAGSGVTTSHVFQAAGSFAVVLTVRDERGATGSASRVIVLVPNTPPLATFSADPQTGLVPLIVQFDASASRDEDGTIASYEWDFADGVSGSGSAPQHIFETPGLHKVRLSVKDDRGASGEVVHEVGVMSAVAAPIYRATIVPFPTGPGLGQGVQLNVTGMSRWRNLVGSWREEGAERDRVFVYSRGVSRDLGFLGVDELGVVDGKVYPHDINDTGDIVGHCFDQRPTAHIPFRNFAFLYRNGAFRDLFPLSGYPDLIYSSALAINNSGQIAGVDSYWAYSPLVTGDSCFSITGETVKIFSMYFRQASCHPVAISDDGVIAVYVASDSWGEIDNAGWLYALNTDLPWTQIAEPPYLGLWPSDMNDHHDVVGTWRKAGECEDGDQGFVYRGGQVSSLVPCGFRPRTINNARVIVGSEGGRAVVWDEVHGLQDLNARIDPPLGRTLASARFINDLGEIIAGDVNDQGEITAGYVLLTPEWSVAK